MIGAGLIEGIDDSQRGVTAAVNNLVAIPTVPSFGVGSGPGIFGAAGGGPTYNTTINQVDDPIGTATAVVRRQTSLAV
jgi:hypothetical protein